MQGEAVSQPEPFDRIIVGVGKRTPVGVTVFELLQHPPRTPERSPFGAGVSVVVHAAILTLVLAGAQPDISQQVSEAETVIETVVKYFLPPDRPGHAAVEAPVHYAPQPTGLQASKDPTLYSSQTRPAGAPQPSLATEQEPPPLAEAAAAQNAFTLNDVDTVAVRDPTSAVPVYPPLLEKQGIEGVAVVRFVVDTTGRADVETFRVVETNHALFGAAVREALPRMKFHPATVGPRRVRQLVEVPFGFQIVRRGGPETTRRP